MLSATPALLKSKMSAVKKKKKAAEWLDKNRAKIIISQSAGNWSATILIIDLLFKIF